MPVDRQELTRRADTWLWDMLAAPDGIPMGWFERRFAFLKAALQEGHFRRDAAIVPELGKRSKLASVEIDGGRDVKYVIVYARQVPENWRPGIQETLTYRRDVAGTDLVYDVTGEFLQGKARPFECDLRQLPLRIYAIMPFQVEGIDLAAQQRIPVNIIAGETKAIEVSFPLRLQIQDAAGSPIAGRLPIYVGLRRRQPALTQGGYTLADDRGQVYSLAARLPTEIGDWSLAARLLLTGVEVSLPVKFHAGEDKRATEEVPLTSEGLTVRKVPRPVQLDEHCSDF